MIIKIKEKIIKLTDDDLNTLYPLVEIGDLGELLKNKLYCGILKIAKEMIGTPYRAIAYQIVDRLLLVEIIKRLKTKYKTNKIKKK